MNQPSLRTRLFLSHMLVIAAGTTTLLIVTLFTAPTLHDRLMIAMLGHESLLMSDPSMVAMERATNAVFQTAMLQALLFSSIAAGSVAVGVSLLVSARIVTPIQRLLAASRRIAIGHYTERVPTEGRDELGALAAQFNTMATALEAAEQRRVSLIGDVAHELRTPLATIEGYVEGVIDRVVAPDDATWALLLDEVGRLRRLVHDLQELSRAEAKQLPLLQRFVHASHIAHQATLRLTAQFAEKQVALITEPIPPAMADPLLLVDTDRMTQVLINLLGNALQHTPSGGQVRMAITHNDHEALFCIQDTGRGVPADDLPHLFERFYRVDKARSRSTGGSGIGLTICKALIEMHAGRIWIESPGIGAGTTVRFTLPLVPVAGSAAAVSAS
ncbi:MAG: ATP-binding protein [Roseiflexaceae bacterium]